MATLTYDYQESTAVLGPLATVPEPHCYDLCDAHAHSLTVPRGWQVVRLATEFEPAPPSKDDIYALAQAVKDASRKPPAPARRQAPSPAENSADGAPVPPSQQRGHLRVLPGGEGS